MNELHEALEELKYLMIRNMSFILNMSMGLIFGATFMYLCVNWG